MKIKKIISAFIINLIIFSTLSLILVPPQPLQASELWKDISEQLGPIGDIYGQTDEPNLAETIAKIIKIVLSFLGIVFIVLIIYAGFRWMTSGGNEEQIRKAKQTLIAAVIGLIIIILAYALTYFVIKSLINATD